VTIYAAGNVTNLEEGVKYYSERTDFPPFWDNFNFTSIESDMHAELRKKYEPMLKK